jgi:hypothetical protein
MAGRKLCSERARTFPSFRARDYAPENGRADPAWPQSRRDHGGREISSRDVASPAYDVEDCFGGKTCARGNVENAHTWSYVSRTQQERHEVSCDRRESTVVPGRRFILVIQVLRHLGILGPGQRKRKAVESALLAQPRPAA